MEPDAELVKEPAKVAAQTDQLRAYRAGRFRPTSALGRVLARHRAEVLALAQAHKAYNVRLFGSVVRGEDDADSDIDLLVDLAPGADLLDLAALELELERLLGHPVDIVPARMLKPHVAPSALADAVELRQSVDDLASGRSSCRLAQDRRHAEHDRAPGRDAVRVRGAGRR
ncbi:nucleotidyltransferase family protein [Actinokineospora sp. HUAS TT18]|uniref:nucleotidyltransferase family protein n=1 Tax=Actinokineospora sp. HUAS TT18 TaxID=3447451 RepID=UPI003F51D00E